jgi:hypothetical protein
VGTITGWVEFASRMGGSKEEWIYITAGLVSIRKSVDPRQSYHPAGDRDRNLVSRRSSPYRNGGVFY